MRRNSNKFMKLSINTTIGLLILRYIIASNDISTLWKAKNYVDVVYNVIGFCGEAVSAAAVAMAIFNKWAWKWRYICKLHGEPILATKYSGTLVSDYDQQEYECELLVSQTFLNISTRLTTKQSSSRSILAEIINMNSVPHLVYTYQNDPRAELQKDSPIHYGTVMLNLSDTNCLSGNYFTSRNTRGSMHLRAN